MSLPARSSPRRGTWPPTPALKHMRDYAHFGKIVLDCSKMTTSPLPLE